MNIKGLELIIHFEGFRAAPYLCSGKRPTIGYGTTMYPDGRQVKMTDRPISQDEATRYLIHHIGMVESQMLDVINMPISVNQWSALVSFTYNFGIGALRSSTLLRLLNAGKIEDAAREFTRWNKSDGVVTPGLVRRREAERRLFLTPDDDEDQI
jgi:lysozyme